VDQQPLAAGEPGLGEQRVVSGGEDLGHPAGLVPVHPRRHRHGHPLVDHGQLRLTAAGHDGHDPVVLGEALCPRSASHHLTGQLQAGDVGRSPRGRRIAAGPLEDVGPVEPGAPHPDEELPGSGPGIGVLAHGDLAVADRGRAHGGRF
jgi:hypothetical protein